MDASSSASLSGLGPWHLCTTYSKNILLWESLLGINIVAFLLCRYFWIIVQIFLDYCYLQDKKYSVKNLFSSLEKHSNKLLFFATRGNTADESDVKTCSGKDVVENDILDDWIVISPKKAETIG